MSSSTQSAVDAWAGNVLRLAREKKCLSQRELARAAGVPPSTIAKIESGRRQPTHPTMARILASIGLALTARLEPYDDHDDVLWLHDQQRSEEQRAAIIAEQQRLFIQVDSKVRTARGARGTRLPRK